MGQDIKLEATAPQSQPSVTDAVYRSLYDGIVRLEMPPGTKLSEAEVANRLDVSRQPVRDAFYRLSQQGFLLVRPQRATIVTKISITAVMRAKFIRTALELEAVNTAMDRMTPEGLCDLDQNVELQAKACEAGDRDIFQQLDDAFHAKICDISGHPEVWGLIKDTKAHMDRVRYLSLDKGKDAAMHEHKDILNALHAGDQLRSATLMREHLSRIGPFMAKIRPEHPDYFEEGDREY